jgi:hypothetical protein
VASSRQEWQRDRAGAEPSVFPPGPSRDHPIIPLARSWRIAGGIVGAIALVIVAAIVGAGSGDSEPEYREILPAAIEIDPVDDSSAFVSVQVDPALPGESRIRVTGDGLVRVEIAGDALCTPVSGAAGGWIESGLCGALDILTVTAYDIDDVITTIVVKF